MNKNEVRIDPIIETEIKEAWKFYDFVDEVSKQFAAMTNEQDKAPTANTINNYIIELEKRNIHHINRIENTRIYDADDLKIVLYICAKRSKTVMNGNVWSLKQIYQAIQDDENLPKRIILDVKDANTDVETLKHDLEEFKGSILENISEMMTNQRLLLETKADIEKNMNNKLVQLLTKQTEVKALARKKWEALPANERMEGLFFKKENISKREKFIDEYVEREMYKWLLESDQPNEDTNNKE